LKVRLATGSHSLTAVYGGVSGASTPTTSNAAEVTVTGIASSATSVFAQPDATNPANYDLTAKVQGYGYTVPTQNVDFTETSLVADLGTVALDPSTAMHTLASPIQNVNGPGTPFGMAIADLNGDGIPDIATSDSTFSLPQNTASVYIGKGDGTFNKPVSYPVQYFADGVTVADFNNDGVPDIAVANQYDTPTSSNGSISVLLGNGDGTFQPAIKYMPPQSLSLSFVVAGDLITMDLWTSRLLTFITATSKSLMETGTVRLPAVRCTQEFQVATTIPTISRSGTLITMATWILWSSTIGAAISVFCSGTLTVHSSLRSSMQAELVRGVLPSAT
jgi:hypothetical protein